MSAEGGCVDAALEDDYHEFAVALRHDGTVVTSITGLARRFPWSTCPGAMEKLAPLRGCRLVALSARLDAKMPVSSQCTHLYDLARVAMAHALRGGLRQYDIAIPDMVDGTTSAQIFRDGQLALDWTITSNTIVAPAPFAGHSLLGRADWPHGALTDADTAEAAMLLRRMTMVALRRAVYASRPSYEDAVKSLGNACHSLQPGLQGIVTGVGETYDFSNRPDALLAHLRVPFSLASHA
jgi:hypothetical protein